MLRLRLVLGSPCEQTRVAGLTVRMTTWLPRVHTSMACCGQEGFTEEVELDLNLEEHVWKS